MGKTKAREAAVASEVVFGHVGDSVDIAYPIVFLCLEWARWIVGTDLNVSAGQVIY